MSDTPATPYLQQRQRLSYWRAQDMSTSQPPINTSAPPSSPSSATSNLPLILGTALAAMAIASIVVLVALNRVNAEAGLAIISGIVFGHGGASIANNSART